MVLLLTGIRHSKVLVPQWHKDRGDFVAVLIKEDLFCSSLWRNLILNQMSVWVCFSYQRG